MPPPEVVDHIATLASLPPHIADRVTDEVEGIYVGPGSVVDLDGLGPLRGRLTDADDPQSRPFERLAGVYLFGVFAVGDLGHESVSLALHEVGHVLDVADQMMSETREWRDLHGACLSRLVKPYWRKRHELWAEAFAITAAHEEEVLVDMLAGDGALASGVLAYFEEHYGVRW